MKTVKICAIGCFLLVIPVLIPMYSFAQDYKVQFKNSSVKDGEKTVTFHIIGIKDDGHQKQVVKFLESDPNIISVNIYSDNKCVAIVGPDLDAEYFQDLLADKEVEIDENSIIKSGTSSTNTVNASDLPPSFPKRIDTGNPYEDEKKLGEAVAKWKQENPDEWEKIIQNRSK